MSAIEWLLWAATIWTVFFLYAALDAPSLLARKWGQR